MVEAYFPTTQAEKETKPWIPSKVKTEHTLKEGSPNARDADMSRGSGVGEGQHPSGEPSKHLPEQTVNRHLVKLLLLSRQYPILRYLDLKWQRFLVNL